MHAREPWERPLSDFPDLVHLTPPTVRPDDSLAALIDAFCQAGGGGVVFVVDKESRLRGAIAEHTLDTDLVTLALPQRLWPSIDEMDQRGVLRAARGAQIKASELMAPANSIKPQASLKHAIQEMTKNKEPLIALVDDQQRLLGYIRLFEVLNHLIQAEQA